MTQPFITRAICALTLLITFSFSARSQLVKTLDNGLQLVVKENHTAPVAAVRIYVKTGSIYEGEYMGTGISHVFEHLISGGTTSNFSEEEIGDKLDRLGGASNAYTTKAHTAYYLTTEAGMVNDAIDLMADWMQNCTFPQKEFDREIGVVLEELYKGKEETNRILSKMRDETQFLVHPTRHPVIGYEDLVKGITRQDIVDYYHLMYVPNNMIVSVAGDFDASAVMDHLVAAFSEMKRRRLPTQVLPEEPKQLGKRVRIERKDNINAAYFMIAFHTVELQHPDLYPLDVASYILSRGNSSRLVRKIRDELRLVNAVSTWSSTPAYGTGSFVVYGVCEDSKFDAATQAIVEEVYRLRDELVTQEEIDKAARQKYAEDILGKQTAEDEAASLGLSLLTTGNPDFDALYLDGIRKVKPAEIQAAANRYFDDDNMTLVALRPQGGESDTTAVASHQPVDHPIQKLTLDNGLTVLLKKNTSSPVINMQAYFMGGVRLEPEGKQGVSSMTASMLTKGTATKSREEIATLLDSRGASLGGLSGNNTIALSAEMLKEDVGTILPLYADVLLHPSFPAEELETLRQNTLGALARRNDNWNSELSNLFREEWFGKHPYGHDKLGTEESVKSMTSDDLKAYHANHIIPERGVLTVFGDFDEETIEETVRKYFGTFKYEASDITAPKAPAALIEDRIVHNPSDRAIAAVYIGYPGTTIDNVGDYYNLQVLDSVLSGIGFPGGRLHENLRGGENDLVYLVHGFNFLGLEPGYFGIMAASSPDKADRVLEIIFKEVETIKTDLVGEEELNKAKQICITMEKLSRQTNGDVATQAAINELYGLGYGFDANFEAGIRAVTAEDLRATAKKYLTHHLLVRTGPATSPQEASK